MSEASEGPSRIPWPPIIYVVAIAVSIALAAFVPLPWLGSPLSDLIFALGWLVLIAVAALYASAISQLRKANTTIHPTHAADHLVTRGAFSVSRNPIYLANSLLMISVGLISGIVWFLIFAVAAGFVTQKLAIEPEERHLKRRFGKKFIDYGQKVRRWI